MQECASSRRTSSLLCHGGGRCQPLRPAQAAARLRLGDSGSGWLDVYVTVVPGGRPRLLAGVAGRDDFSPAWSPDGKLIAYRLNPGRGDEGDIMVVPAGGGKPRNLARSPSVADWSPAWSPDGRSIAFFSGRAGGRDIWTMRPDGTGMRRLTNDAALNEYPTWSPDGTRIAFQTPRAGEFEIFVTASNGGRPHNLTRHPGRDQWAAWSPDGRWIAFMSMRDGSEDIFIVRTDGTGARNVTRTRELQESHPTWSPTGELTFTRHAETGQICYGPFGRMAATLGVCRPSPSRSSSTTGRPK